MGKINWNLFTFDNQSMLYDDAETIVQRSSWPAQTQHTNNTSDDKLERQYAPFGNRQIGNSCPNTHPQNNKLLV